MYRVGDQPCTHVPVEVTDRAPRGFEVADPIEQGTSDQELRDRDVDRSAKQVKQAVEWRSANMKPIEQVAAAVSEHRALDPPFLDRAYGAAVLIDGPQRAVRDVAFGVLVER